jgi:hypothetical protein
VAVDHVPPRVLMTRDGKTVTALGLESRPGLLRLQLCQTRPPVDWMPWLEQGGEHLIVSRHPLRETLISQLGPDPAHRHQTLARRHTAAHGDDPALVTTRRQGRPLVSATAQFSPWRRTGTMRATRRTTARPEDNRSSSTETNRRARPRSGLSTRPGREHADPVSTETNLGE